MIIRFVQGEHTLASWGIEARENIAMPFCPSHVEILSRDGSAYIGAHFDGGIRARPIGYDAATVKAELKLDIGTDGDEAAFKYAEEKIGEPYDWTAIIDFVLPLDLHRRDYVICSAFTTLTLRQKGFFKAPLAVPAHLISPRDLLLILSAMMPVPGI